MRGLWIGVAGFAGAVCRYWLDGVVSRVTGGGFPWGTWVVNVSGCLLIGVLATVLNERLMPHPALRLSVTIGFVGAYTTFSTFAYETVRLAQDGAVGIALVNVVASVVTGVVACWVGILVGRAL